MGLSAPHRVWLLGQAVAKKTPLSDPRRWGVLPFELAQYKHIMPVLMHGKTIGFANIQTKHSHSRRSFIPNILYRPLYSRSLGMSIWSCVSSRALREIDAFGGFDEYITQISQEKLGNDPVTAMYKRKILEAQLKNKNSSQKQMEKLLEERYGKEYLEKIQQVKSW